MRISDAEENMNISNIVHPYLGFSYEPFNTLLYQTPFCRLKNLRQLLEVWSVECRAGYFVS